jgi:hypothetical protein
MTSLISTSTPFQHITKNLSIYTLTYVSFLKLMPMNLFYDRKKSL